MGEIDIENEQELCSALLKANLDIFQGVEELKIERRSEKEGKVLFS